MDYKIQLQRIQLASGWSQEQLAAELGVSFPTLNAWLNDRAKPRVRALNNIDRLYLSILGATDVLEEDLTKAKDIVRRYPLEAKTIIADQKILSKLALHLTYHTNTIEGSTMTLADVEDVIFDNKVLSNRTAIEQLEARNHQAALYWLLDQVVNAKGRFIINEEIILGMHLRLMNGIVSDAGQYRKHAVRIMGTHVPLANWQKIPALIMQLIDAQAATKDLITSLAIQHASFEKIHPFSDGNGRTGRLMMLAQALNAGIAPPIVRKERKQAYYKYLEIAQTKDDYIPLELFIAQSVEFSGELLKPK